MTPTQNNPARFFFFFVGLALLTSSISANEQGSKRRGPPPQAIEACANQVEGAVCGFSAPHGEVQGSCIIPPRDEAALVCAPDGGPPKRERPSDFDSQSDGEA